MHLDHRLCYPVSMRWSMCAAEHTCQGQQFVCDKDGCVVLAAIEGFLAPLTKIFLHNVAIASNRVYLARSVCFFKTVSPVEVAVGGCAVLVPGSRLPDARAHVCGVPAAAGRLSQPEVPLLGCLHPDVISDTQHPLRHLDHITRHPHSPNAKRCLYSKPAVPNTPPTPTAHNPPPCLNEKCSPSTTRQTSTLRRSRVNAVPRMPVLS